MYKNSAKEMKTEEKTVREWLNTLKEPYKSKALNNCNKSIINSKVTNLVKALYYAFDWQDSNEGFEYWKDLTSSLENKEI